MRIFFSREWGGDGEARTLEVGDGGGAGGEGDDDAGAEGRLQEDRRGVAGGHRRPDVNLNPSADTV